jgi:hypothetical protein
MAASPVEVRCPACGQPLRAVLASAPPTQWFPCPKCHLPVPVVVPRDPPPLFTWEVVPGLYPMLPPPRAPRWRARRATAVALVVLTVVSAAFAAVLAEDSWSALQPGGFTVDGTVREAAGSGSVPAAGASVVLIEEGNRTVSELTGADGTFVFRDVPAGGITVNVSLPGYSNAVVSTFVSSVYDAGTTGLSVLLVRGSAGESVSDLSPFPDLETFVAAVGAAAVILALVALLGALAAVATVRADRPAVGVVAGAAGTLAPLALHFLAMDVAFPIVFYGLAITAAVGAFVVALRAVELAQTGPAVGPD